MKPMFERINLGRAELANRFVFPPIKLAYGNPDGTVTDRQLTFYEQIAKHGPGLLILEPVAVTPEGKEHPRQLCVHLAESASELARIVQVIHAQDRLACLHLNHAGAAANPKATQTSPLAPSPITCPMSGQVSEALTGGEIDNILAGYAAAARKAVEAGFDLIEVQAGHGYLVSQFMNKNINKREDAYGVDRLRFAAQAMSAVREGAPDLPFLVRISGNDMSPEYGLPLEDLAGFLDLAEEAGACAVHVGMGSACFSPPWYFHHAGLPQKPQTDALAWVRSKTPLPVVAAGRMGRRERVLDLMDNDLADLVALGRPLIADPDLIAKWEQDQDREITLCGYCLQGCLHRVKNGEPLGCNLNPAVGLPDLQTSNHPLKVLVAGGGPAGMSAALYLSKRGHRVSLAEQTDHLGGQFALVWRAPGKELMKDGLYAMEHAIKTQGVTIRTSTRVDAALADVERPDLLVWAVGAEQNIPDIPGLDTQNTMTSLEFFAKSKDVQGPRVLVIGAGRTGLEIVEALGQQGLEVVATKRTDPIGSMMEMITKTLTLKRIEAMKHVTLMPHTRVKAFLADSVDLEQDGARMSMEPFDSVILASGMRSAPGPDKAIREAVAGVKVIGDAEKVQDIFTATQAGYRVALDT